MTRAGHLTDLGVALGRVFVHPAYVLLAGALAILTFLLAVLVPNFGLISEIFADASVPMAAKLGIALSLLGGIGTNFSLLSAGYTVAIAILFGLTVAMIAFSIRQRSIGATRRSIALGSGAMLSGVLGIGCAACGSLIMGAVVPFLGIAGAVAMLPLDGQEFGILSVALLFISLLLVSKNIAESAACALLPDGGDQGF
ncbi:MAG: hypothetical protein A3G25_13000 [Betaproteobacteria bacterium RIFCSPLOWO2_12_FULL_63_13]|nr:MAG: hypothetical protein A3G25_13000 [Betaproteobacteria bacterium RIFCSPLOWO2_12_FULL_63_13]